MPAWTSVPELDRDATGRLTRAAFRRDYVVARLPIVLRGLVDDWSAVATWSPESLSKSFFDVEVTTARAAAGSVLADREVGFVHAKAKLGEYLEALAAGDRDRYLISSISELPADLRRAAPPPLLCAGASWIRGNVWIGGEGTGGMMHRDLADNLHAQVVGRKRFALVSPRHSASVYPNGIFDSVPNGCRADIDNPDLERFPRLRSAIALETELGPGDVLYIPRRWWHKGLTLETSISVNYWWASGVRRALVAGADLFKRVRGVSR